MKKAAMYMTAAILALSLSACTPTSEKGRTGEIAVEQSQAASGNVQQTYEHLPDPTAPELDIVAVYTVSDDGTQIEGTIDAVEELNEQALVDLLIQYGTLEEGTEILDFTTEGTVEVGNEGPGAPAGTGTMTDQATLNLNQFPDTDNEQLLQAVANTFLENLQISRITIQVNGETVAEDLS